MVYTNPCSAGLRIYCDLDEAQSRKGEVTVARLVGFEYIYLPRKASRIRLNENEHVADSF